MFQVVRIACGIARRKMETLDFDERNYQRAVDVVATYSKNRKLRNKMGLVLAIRAALNQATQDDNDSERIRLSKENQHLRERLQAQPPRLNHNIVSLLIQRLRYFVFSKGTEDSGNARKFKNHSRQATYAEERLIKYIRTGKER